MAELQEEGQGGELADYRTTSETPGDAGWGCTRKLQTTSEECRTFSKAWKSKEGDASWESPRAAARLNCEV